MDNRHSHRIASFTGSPGQRQERGGKKRREGKGGKAAYSRLGHRMMLSNAEERNGNLVAMDVTFLPCSNTSKRRADIYCAALWLDPDGVGKATL